MSERRNNIISAGALLATSIIPGPVDDALAMPLVELLTQAGVDTEGQDFQQAVAAQDERLRSNTAKDGSEITDKLRRFEEESGAD